jgi:SOS response regulatory protein OraA/RecX
MEVKFERTGLGQCKINIYIDDFLWRTVKTSYYEKRLPELIKSGNFKEKFAELERKKCINVSVYLLSKRSYLKKEWISKMLDKLFPAFLLEAVYEEHLSPYFDEEEEVRRKIVSYLGRGKGKSWIKQKIKPHLSLSEDLFSSMLYEYCSDDAVIEKIVSIESTRNLINTKGRDKTIAFFMRRGFSYHLISKALFS